MKTILLILVLMGILSCNSNKNDSQSALSPQGPFLKSDLENYGLLKIDYSNETIIRTIYPPVALDVNYKYLLDNFITSIDDIQAFIPVDSTEKNYKLGVYMYEYGNTPDFVSIAIECEFKYPTSPPFTMWYTFNYDIQNYSFLNYDTMFTDKTQALLKISRYIIQDVTRQKKLRGVDVKDDIYLTLGNSLLVNLFDNYVLIPSTETKNKFIGIKIYLNRFGVEEDSNYAINVSTYYFQSFLKKKIASKFVEEEVPLISSSPTQERNISFPDIAPLF